jgi:outer membrane putative beta-barrel porin/alpha-amylase
MSRHSFRRAVAALAFAAGLIVQAPAAAQELRDFCPDRPGRGTPPCTIDPGRGDLELGLADWTLTRDQGARTDDLIFGAMLVRYGLDKSLEAQIGWTAAGIQRMRDPGGRVGRQSGTGDLLFALKQNLVHPDGSGFSLALLPFATLPTGTGPLRTGTWGAALVVPLSYQLPHGLQLAFTGEADAAPNSDGQGRHFAYDGVLGLNFDLGKQVGATFELAAYRNEDPAGSSSRLIGAASIAWKPRSDLQLDTGVSVGLAGQAPAVELSLGVSRRF